MSAKLFRLLEDQRGCREIPVSTVSPADPVRTAETDFSEFPAGRDSPATRDPPASLEREEKTELMAGRDCRETRVSTASQADQEDSETTEFQVETVGLDWTGHADSKARMAYLG